MSDLLLHEVRLYADSFNLLSFLYIGVSWPNILTRMGQHILPVLCEEKAISPFCVRCSPLEERVEVQLSLRMRMFRIQSFLRKRMCSTKSTLPVLFTLAPHPCHSSMYLGNTSYSLVVPLQ